MKLSLRSDWLKTLQKVDGFLFPKIDIYPRKLSVRAQLLAFAVLTALFSLVGLLIPADGFFAFDWVNFFGSGRMPLFYPPWVTPTVKLLNWPLLVGLTLAAVSFSIYKRGRHLPSAVFALLTLPLFWTLFLGQVDGLVVLGLLALPWSTPLALFKPQVAVFALGARRSYILAALVTLIVSFMIWGFWPVRLLTATAYYGSTGYVQDIALGVWGIPIALVLIWFSRGDMDMLMAAGVFGTLHLIPFNLLPLTPAIARLKPPAAAVACLLSWLPLGSNWLGPWGWWLGWLFVIWLWLNLAAQRYGWFGMKLAGETL